MVSSAIAIFGLSVNFPALVRLLGRCHPAVVHFPIALITVAAAMESWQLLRRKPGLALPTPTCLVLGSVSAALAALCGWVLEDSGERGGAVMGAHKWIGIIATVGVIGAAGLLPRATSHPGARMALRSILFIAAGLVGFTGYMGGELVFGRNHLFKGIFDDEPPTVSSPDAFAAAPNPQQATAPPPPPPHRKTSTSAPDQISFTTAVAPILQEHCVRCHGGEKVKAKLSLKTKADALKGGRNGDSIVPGHPDKSLLYTMLIEADEDSRMPPPKEKQLSKEQIGFIRAWIEQGAEWPDGVEMK